MNYVKFNADGSLNEQSFEYYVQQGDSNNQFFVILDGGLASDSAIGVCVLPNGETNTISGVWNSNYQYAEGETADGWLFTLTTAQTELSGLLQIAIYVNRGSTIKVSYPLGIIVNETGVKPDLDTGITIEELNSYLVELQKYALKDHVIYLEERLTTDPLSLIGTGPHFVKVNGVYYFFTISGSGTITFTAINLSNPKDYYTGSVADSTTLATALSSTYLLTFVDTASNQTITGEKTFDNDIKVNGSVLLYNEDTESYDELIGGEGGGGDYSFPCFKSSLGITGNLEVQGHANCSTAPTANYHLTNKKYVDDEVQDVREVAEGKCKTYVIDDTQASLTSSFFNGTNKVYKTNGDEITTWADFQTYVNSGTCANADFAVQTSQVNIVNKYILTTEKVVIINLDSGMHTGDIILVKQLNVPDRWFEPGIPGVHSDYYNILETTKVDLSNYVTLDGTQTITGKKTIEDTELEFKNSSSTYYWSIDEDTYEELRFKYNNSTKFYIGNGIALTQSLRPITNNTYNLGSSSYAWQECYIGAIKNGNVTYQEFAGGHTVVYGRLRPGTNGTVDLGQSNFRWQNGYFSGYLSDGTSSFLIDTAYKLLFNKNVSNNLITELDYEVTSTISLSSNTTLTLKAAPTNCLPEYRAIITASAAITLTFTGVSNFLTNDPDNVVITNGTNTTVALASGTTIEVSIMNGKGVAVNFEVA